MKFLEKCNLKGMKTADAFWQFLPEGLDELFEMVKFEKTDQSYDHMA